MNDNNKTLSKCIWMLEFEKNIIKLEIGNQKEAEIYKDFDSASLWLSIDALSSRLK